MIRSVDERFSGNLVMEMVRIPSVVGEEGALAEFLYQELQALGLQMHCQSVEPGRHNIYGTYEFGGPKPVLMFNGHLDTVPPCDGWNTDPFAPTVKAGRLYGLGACDMKAGFAAVLAALKALISSDLPLKGTVAFSGVVDEEGYSKGANALLKTPLCHVDGIISAEPDFGDEKHPIPLGMTGKALVELLVRGRAGHAFHPEEGINAVEDAAELLSALSEFERPAHPTYGKPPLCALKIEGGYKTYSVVVPDRCSIILNILTAPGESLDTLVQELRQFVDTRHLASEVSVKLRAPSYEPYEIGLEERLVQDLRDAYRAVLKREPRFSHARSISDANVFAGRAGIPTINFGPKGGGIHQANEYVELASIPLVARVYALTAFRYLLSVGGE